MSEETLTRIAGWCEADRDLDLDGTTVTEAGHPPVEIAIEMGDDALTLTHLHAVADPPTGFADAAVEMLNERGSMVSGEVLSGTDATEVHVRYPIYLEGLNRQSFAVAIREVTRTVDGLRRLESAGAGNATGASTASAARPTPPPTEDDAHEPAAQAAAAAPWAASHQVPPSGMQAWSEPNPSLTPIASLAPGVQLRVDEIRGAWAHVSASNGWRGWVDNRILQPIGAAPAAGWAPAAGGGAAAGAWSGSHPKSGLAILPLIGGIMLMVAAFLAWGDWSYGTGMDFSVFWIWPLNEVETFWSWDQPRIGMVLIVVGVLAVIAALIPKFPAAIRVVSGILGLLLAVGVILDIIINGDAGHLFDARLTGVWVGFVGSILVLIPGPRIG